MPGSLSMNAHHAAHGLHLLQLHRANPPDRSPCPFSACGQFGGLFLVDLALDFSISDSTSPMPRMRWRPVRMEGSSASVFSPTPRNLIGLPVMARTDKAAPPRASPSTLVRITPVSGRLVEGLGGVGGILTGHGVHHEQRFHRIDRGVQALDLAIMLVDVQATGGIDNQHIEELDLGLRGNGAAGDVHRILAEVGLGKKVHPTSPASVSSCLMAAGR
jgi:hypothetical protein